MVMIRSGSADISSITVSDPSRKLERLTLTINRKIRGNEEHFKIIPDDSGNNSLLEILLPENKFRGNSITLKTE